MQKVATILVIDDDPDIGKMLQMMLEYKGYTVILLNKAFTIQEILLENNINLVILDMLIGSVNGTDICKIIKNNNAIAHIPVLMISAMPHARQACIDAGANDFIAKPFEMQELLTNVHRLTKKDGNPETMP